ncbi:unnamed protein product [Adineta ricciae]|uniref:Uncharacterized protein n=1 Tax=Adineta ricciae TaxID=249248 RepID=A0A814VLF9_ADIRI|nr:unnamed protein product [Adineta ricciae]
MSKSHANRPCISIGLLGLLISIVYLAANHRLILHVKSIPTVQIQSKSVVMKPRAYIITADCYSTRFNATKQNVERAFPNFFEVVCFLAIPLNDSRISFHSSAILFRKWASNLLAFVELWTYEIPKHCAQNELQWSFIFEDDVNFYDLSKVSLKNYISPLQEMMSHPDVHLKDGFFYLGICEPKYNKDTQMIVLKDTNNSVISKRNYGYCLHATAITAKRSRIFWGEIASYRPNANEKSLDYQLREFSMRSKSYFYTFGSNLHYPPGTGHFGVAFQDRGKFWSTVT